MKWTRPCLVCQEQCSSEGQLCSACVEEGASVTDDTVTITLSLDLPDWTRHE